MSVRTSRRKSAQAPAEVAEYLRLHPEFFEDHPELLETLRLPHRSGEAVSLVTRQMQILRDKNHRLQEQLNDIVHIARDNDALYHRLHQLTLALLGAAGLEDALAGLKWGLHQYFQADLSAVRLVWPRIETPLADLYLAADSPAQTWFETLLAVGKPECGTLDSDQARELFGAENPASCALIPLQHAGLRGLLAIGSEDPNRFQAGLGALFLTQLGDIVAARLATLVSGRS